MQIFFPLGFNLYFAGQNLKLTREVAATMWVSEKNRKWHKCTHWGSVCCFCSRCLAQRVPCSLVVCSCCKSLLLSASLHQAREALSGRRQFAKILVRLPFSLVFMCARCTTFAKKKLKTRTFWRPFLLLKCLFFFFSIFNYININVDYPILINWICFVKSKVKHTFPQD